MPFIFFFVRQEKPDCDNRAFSGIGYTNFYELGRLARVAPESFRFRALGKVPPQLAPSLYMRGILFVIII